MQARVPLPEAVSAFANQGSIETGSRETLRTWPELSAPAQRRRSFVP